MSDILTGRVAKVEDSCFAMGGFADVWVGKMVNDGPDKVIVEVRISFNFFSWSLCNFYS
jgi:hypothetical protein